MNRSQIATARHHAYLLVSRIFLNGLSPDLLVYVRQLPELAAFAPDQVDQDELAARHYHIFGHDILPYESIFRDASGLLGGQITTQVNTFYQASGVDFPHEGDHFGQEVAFLAALCHAEATACQRDDTMAADLLARNQAQFLAYHLLPWLSPFLTAVEFSNDHFYAALGGLTLRLVADHWRALVDLSKFGWAAEPGRNRPAGLMSLMQQERTNLKTIAGYLVAPPLSGFYLSIDTIAGIARDNRLPRGFGNRRQILTNLFHSAAQYDLLPKVLHDLESTSLTCRQTYQRQIDMFPDLLPFTKPWIVLVENTSAALREMIALASEAATSA